MDFLKGNIKEIYYKYLFAAFGSTFLSSIYSIVDMAMVGRYEGSLGTAALAVVAPMWNVIYSLGLLMGIGGGVMFSILRGKGEREVDRSNAYFTVSLLGSLVLAFACQFALLAYEDEILKAFGASPALLPLAKEYVRPIKYILPSFLLTQMLSAFLRNDGNPALATRAVLAGGIFNVFGDYYLVFTRDLGIYGAGLATAIGSVISLIFMVTHFFSKKNTLKIVSIRHFGLKLKTILVNGLSSFFIDVAMGFLTILFNRQIRNFLGDDALAIYGIIVNISTFVQCCAYSVGQAGQPIISANFGAGEVGRIRETLNYCLKSVAFFGAFRLLLNLVFPDFFIRIFLKNDQEILDLGRPIIRTYGLSFLLLPFNIFSTYYFQALLKAKVAFKVSILRGLVISGLLILSLPEVSPNLIRMAMPITEALVAVFAGRKIKVFTGELERKERN